MADGDFPSGSGWGGLELQRIGFELESRPLPLASFPWNDFISNHEVDPCIKIDEKLKAMFGLQSADTDHDSALTTKSFYEDLNELLELPMAVASERIYRTRSKPALPESSPMTLLSSPLQSSTTYLRNRETFMGTGSNIPAPSQVAGQNTIVYDQESQESQESQEQFDQPYSSSDEKSENSETEQTPRPTDVKRRRLSAGYQARRSNSKLDNVPNSTQSEGLVLSTDLDIESDQKSLNKTDIMKLPFTPTRTIRPFLTPVEEQLLSSRPSDFSYEPSSPLQQSGITPPDPKTLLQRDQAEVNTNSMVHLLLKSIFQGLLNIDNKSGLQLDVRYDADNLKVPVRGQFITTKPDLKVTLRMNKEVVTILDYEGKRLEPNMTIVEKFGQRVCHMIGRANQDMASDTTNPRTVYLIAAQHTSISILTCKLKRKWLLMLREEDLTPLARIPKRFVNEYGPADLTNPYERILFVQMLCRLLAHLINVSKFGDNKNNKDDKDEKTDKDNKGNKDNEDNKDDKDDKDDKDNKNRQDKKRRPG